MIFSVRAPYQIGAHRTSLDDLVQRARRLRHVKHVSNVDLSRDGFGPDAVQRDDETLSSRDFQWDEQADEYRCPQGNVLRKQRRTFKNLCTHITKTDTIIYRASQSDCASCTLKTRCPNTPMRKIARSVHESAREVARGIATTDGYKQSRKDRKKVEMLFAHIKRILKLDRLRLRGPNGAQDEFPLAAIAQTYDEWRRPLEIVRAPRHDRQRAKTQRGK